MRQLHLLGATGKHRVEMYNGREHLVVPVVALIEGVIHPVNAPTKEYVSQAVLARAAHTWNGRHVVWGHPAKDGIQVSANDPRILESHGIGQVFYPKMDGRKLVCEAWIDTAKALKVGAGELVKKILADEMCEVSVGAQVATDNAPGDFEGVKFAASWRETHGDHLAFLPKGVGACSIEMGCGGNRAAQQWHLVTAEGMVEEDKSLMDRVKAMFRSLMPRGWGDDEVKQEVRDALLAAEPTLRNGEIVRVLNDKVIYCLYPPLPMNEYDLPGKVTHWSRAISFNNEMKRYTVDGARVQVEPAMVYEPMRVAEDGSLTIMLDVNAEKLVKAAVRTAKKGYEDCSTCKGSGAKDGNPCEACEGFGELKVSESTIYTEELVMNKAERIAALLKNEHNPLKSQSALDAADDCGLTALENHCAAAAAMKTKAVDDAAALKAAQDATETLRAAAAAPRELTEVELLKVMPAEMRSLIERAKATDAARRTQLVSSLKAAQDGYTEAELTEMPLDQLEKVAKAVKVEAPVEDYSGRGTPKVLSGGEDFTPPNPYDLAFKAAKAAQVN